MRPNVPTLPTPSTNGGEGTSREPSPHLRHYTDAFLSALFCSGERRSLATTLFLRANARVRDSHQLPAANPGERRRTDQRRRPPEHPGGKSGGGKTLPRRHVRGSSRRSKMALYAGIASRERAGALPPPSLGGSRPAAGRPGCRRSAVPYLSRSPGHGDCFWGGKQLCRSSAQRVTRNLCGSESNHTV